MHIGIDTREIARPDTGIGSYVSNLVRALAATDDDSNKYTLFVEAAPTDQPFPSRFSLVPIERSATDKWQDQWILPRTVDRLGLDLFHVTHHDVTPLLMHTPLMVTVHDIAPMDFPNPAYVHRVYYRWMTMLSLKKASHIICISNSTRERIKLHFPTIGPKISTIYYGRDDSFHPVTDSTTFVTIASKIGIQAPFMLYVGSFTARKNISNIVAATNLIQRQHPDIQMVFVGAPSGANDYEFEGLEASKIVFAGQINDKDMLCALYSHAELLLFPSLYEGFGLPPLEALACGCPVVTSAISSLPEVVGNAAMLVDPHDPHSIAAGALKIIEYPSYRKHLVDTGLNQAKQFQWDKTAESTQQIYQNTLNQLRKGVIRQ